MSVRVRGFTAVGVRGSSGLAAAVLLISLALAGCAGKEPTPETLPVTGTVTYKGKPLPAGSITFYPESGMPGSGPLNDKGEFTLTTFAPGDGAVRGQHKVVVKAFNSSADVGLGNPSKESNIPPKYNDVSTTPLTATVQDEVNELTFELTD